MDALTRFVEARKQKSGPPMVHQTIEGLIKTGALAKIESCLDQWAATQRLLRDALQQEHHWGKLAREVRDFIGTC
jgi:hypothetical protein